MKTKLIKTELGEFLAVAVPKEIVSVELLPPRYCSPYFSIQYQYDKTQPYTHGGFALFYKDFGGKKKYPKVGDLVVLGFADQEEVAKQVIREFEVFEDDEGQYSHYMYSCEVCKEAFYEPLEAMQSLLKSEGIESNLWQKILLLKKIG